MAVSASYCSSVHLYCTSCPSISLSLSLPLCVCVCVCECVCVCLSVCVGVCVREGQTSVWGLLISLLQQYNCVPQFFWSPIQLPTLSHLSVSMAHHPHLI